MRKLYIILLLRCWWGEKWQLLKMLLDYLLCQLSLFSSFSSLFIFLFFFEFWSDYQINRKVAPAAVMCTFFSLKSTVSYRTNHYLQTTRLFNNIRMLMLMEKYSNIPSSPSLDFSEALQSCGRLKYLSKIPFGLWVSVVPNCIFL